LQEEREAELLQNYIQWKAIQDDIAKKKQHLEALERVERARVMEIINEEQRINDELVRFRDQAKALRISNESLIEKLDRIEDNLYDEARSIRRETLLKHPQKQQQKGLSGGSGHVITDDGLDVTTSETYIESLQLKYSNNNNAEDDDNDNNDDDDDDDTWAAAALSLASS